MIKTSFYGAIIGVVALMYLTVSCTQQPKVPQLQAVHSDRWCDIEEYIYNNWLNYVDTVPSLPEPYSYALNPGTLYYWDLYFINEGLMIQEYWEQAQNNIDCFIYEIEKLGYVPNANRWGEDRSMTPYFAMMVKSYYEKSPAKDKSWLKRAYNAALKEYEFWTNTNGNNIEDHSTSVPGLQRYSHHSDSAKLVRFYDRVIQGRFNLDKNAPIETKILMGGNRLAEAECMDFTPRFYGRIMDFIPVDLNSNLYQYEMVIGWMEKILNVSDGKEWSQKAEQRAKLIRKYLWNEERGLFLDYDFVNNKHTSIASIITLMPL
jgi:alpha,alpha-trehalase